MVLLLRGLFLLLVHTLHSVEGAKAPTKADGLSLADATLLVLDGVADEGMQIARSLLAKEDTNVNLEVETDDESKGTPLAVAIASMGQPDAENAMDLINALLARKDVDVNAPLKVDDGSTVPPLVLAMKVVAAGTPAGLEITKALLAQEKIAVNAMTTGGMTQLAALHMALAAAARGAGSGLEVAGLLLGRSDIDAEVQMVGPDGSKMTPLMKLGTMLMEQPSDANLIKAIALLRGKAKPLEDEKIQKLIDTKVPKDEL